MPHFQQIEPAELQRLHDGGSVVLLDVRTDAEVARGVLPAARHIPLHLLPERVGELDPAATTVIYCQSGGRSAQACAWLEGHGFTALYNLRGGIIAWVRDGHPIHPPC
jgi:rhodanese-related sulfurtransferase